MKKTGKVKKNKGLQLLDLFFCFPVIGGILCANGKDMALCQVLRQGDLRLVSFRQKQFVWHHKIPILRGIEFVANGVWAFAVGFWRSCKSFYTPPEKAKEKTIFQLFIAFLIFLAFFVHNYGITRRKKQKKSLLCLQEIHFRSKETHRLK